MTTGKKVLIFLLVFVVIIGVVVYIIVANNKPKDDEFTKNDTENAVNNTTNVNTNKTGNEELNEIATENADRDFETKERANIQEDTNFKEVEVKGTDTEKAIALAKNTWKVDNGSVSYNIVRQEGNICYVSVNSSETTEVLVWYKINVENGEVSEY